MREVDVLDDQTFGEQRREIIPEPHLVQVRHLQARTITQYYIAQHEGRQQGTTQGANLYGAIEPTGQPGAGSTPQHITYRVPCDIGTEPQQAAH
jgi:hypothetical protein